MHTANYAKVVFVWVIYCSEAPDTSKGVGGDNAHTNDNFSLVATNQKISRSSRSCAVNKREGLGDVSPS